MCIDKSGHHDHAFRIEILRVGKFDLSFPDLFYLVVFHPDGTVFDHLHVVIHGDDASIEYNCSCHSLNFYAKVSDISG